MASFTMHSFSFPPPHATSGLFGKEGGGGCFEKSPTISCCPSARPGVLGEAFLGWNGGGENERKRIRRNRGGPLGVRMTGGLNREQGFMKF